MNSPAAPSRPSVSIESMDLPGSPTASPSRRSISYTLHKLTHRGWAFRAEQQQRKLTIHPSHSHESVLLPGATHNPNLNLRINTNVGPGASTSISAHPHPTWRDEPPAYTPSPVSVASPAAPFNNRAGTNHFFFPPLSDAEAEYLQDDNMAWGPPSARA